MIFFSIIIIIIIIWRYAKTTKKKYLQKNSELLISYNCKNQITVEVNLKSTDTYHHNYPLIYNPYAVDGEY